MNKILRDIIEENKQAVDNIAGLENAINAFEVRDEKGKATFGNLCILLKGYRMVAEATECILINEGIVKDDNGNFYEKVKMNEEPTENTAEPNTTKSE